MRVRFTEVFDHRPAGEPRVTVRFRPDGGAARDGVYTVTRDCGVAAKKAGRAVTALPATRGTGDVQRG